MAIGDAKIAAHSALAMDSLYHTDPTAALEALGRSDAAEAVRAEPSELRCAAVVDSLAHRVRTALEQSRAVTTLLRCKSL